MQPGKKISIWLGAILLTFILGLWLYYITIALRHTYVLTDCSKGEVDWIPKHLCQAYLFNFRDTSDEVTEINHDGSLLGVISTKNKIDRIKLLEFWLNKGVDINGLDERAGISSLHSAVLDNNIDMVELLLQHGANPLIKDTKRNLTPLEFALRLTDKTGQPDRTAIIKLLEAAKS